MRLLQSVGNHAGASVATNPIEEPALRTHLGRRHSAIVHFEDAPAVPRAHSVGETIDAGTLNGRRSLQRSTQVTGVGRRSAAVFSPQDLNSGSLSRHGVTGRMIPTRGRFFAHDR